MFELVGAPVQLELRCTVATARVGFRSKSPKSHRLRQNEEKILQDTPTNEFNVIHDRF